MHLDPTKFKGRMPDRDVLLDPVVSGHAITESISEAIRAHLTARAAEMAPEDFIHQYADLALQHEMLDLLNSIPFVPSRWVGKYEDTPILDGTTVDSRISDRGLPKAVSREEIERVGIFLTDDSDDDLRASLACHARSCFVMSRYLRDGHWLSSAVTDLSPDQFTLSPGKVIGSGTIGVYGFQMTVCLCEELHLVSEVDHPSLAGRIAIHSCVDENVLYVTQSANLSDALKQITNFEDDERFDDGAHSLAYDELDAMIQTLTHDDPTLLLKCYLDAGIRVSTPDQLRGKRFTVAFNEEGLFTIAQAA